jgi:hypothetical protein
MSAVAPAQQKLAKGSKKSKKAPKGKHTNTGRVITTIAIILLFLVIITALAIQYWQSIFPSLVQFISQFGKR